MTAATVDFPTYWTAVEEGDERSAVAVAQRALHEGASVEEVLHDLVVAAQLRVGELWATNVWTVSREHAATAVGERVVRHLASTLTPVEGEPELLVACVEREWHAMPALVLAQTLRAWGHRVEYLGPSTGRDNLIGKVVDAGPRAVLLSASLGSSLTRVRRQVEAIRGTGTPVVVGGSAFDRDGRQARALGATAYAADAETFVAMLDGLPRHVDPAPALRHPGANEARGIQVSVEKIGQAVTDVLVERLGLDPASEPDAGPDTWQAVLVGHVQHLLECLAGALLTEDPSVLADNRTWLAEVLAGRGAPEDAITALCEAMAEELREYPESCRLLEATGA